MTLERPPQGSRFYRPELDALRFFAFLGVYLHHTLPRQASFYVEHHLLTPSLAAFATSVGVAGAYGVDLFFVLSSYLITELLMREVSKQGKVHIKDFYVRRMLRIWPLYFAFIAIALLLPMWDSGQTFGLKHALAFALFSGNWIFVVKNTVNSIAIPLWSVSVEEQFYLSWPLVIRRSSGKRIVRTAIWLLVIAFLTRLLLCFVFQNVGVWNNTFARLDPIALGAIVAATLHGRSPKLSIWGRFVLIVGGLGSLLLVARFCPMEEHPVQRGVLLGYPLIAISCVALLVGTLVPSESNAWPMKTKALVYLGRISYGLYIFHKFSLLLVRHSLYTGRGSVGVLVASWFGGLLLTILIASGSYRWLEQPFLRLKHRFTHIRSGPESETPLEIVATNLIEKSSGPLTQS